MIIPFPIRLIIVLTSIVYVGAFAPALGPETATWLQTWICRLLLIGFVLCYRNFLRDLLRYLLEHPFQAGILGLLLAMLYGRVGVEYGIPEVFWSEYGIARMLSAFAVTMLLSVLGINAYYFDPHPEATRLERERYLELRGWKKFARTRMLLRKSRVGRRLIRLVFNDVPREPFRNAHDLQQFLRLVRLPFLTLASLPALFPLVFPLVPRGAPAGRWILADPNVGHGGAAWLAGVLWWAAGLMLGILANRLLLRLSTLIDAVRLDHMQIRRRRPRISRILRLPRPIDPARCSRLIIPFTVLAAALTLWEVFAPGDSLLDNQLWSWLLFLVDLTALALISATVAGLTAARHPVLWISFSRYLVQVTITLITLLVWDLFFHFLSTQQTIPGLTGLSRLEASPGMAICVLLASLSVLGAWFYMMGSQTTSEPDGSYRWVERSADPATRVRQALPLLIALILWIGLVNNAPYKNRFPNLSYAAPVDLRKRIAEIYPQEPPLGRSTRASQNEDTGLLSNQRVLTEWVERARREQGTSRPKLVVICSSGGASRAAFWTGVVLERLRSSPELKGFDQSVRIITGASGGMVGASYYVAERMRSQERARVRAERDPERYRKWLDDFETNPLARVTSHIALAGFPLMLLPRLPFIDLDRGIVLENQFIWRSDRAPALDLPIASLRQREAAGEIPSLIYTPVIVDDGRRLLISNLDLESLAVNRGTLLTEDYDPRRQESARDRFASLAGIEFFKVFKDNGADRLTLATAARMSASFPFVSPAVNLPSRPPLRLVDAGYYDNFGTNLAAVWIGENWQTIADLGVSGVVLIQIRAFLGRQERSAPLTGREPDFDPSRGYELINTPIKAFTSGRFTGSVFRNDAELAALMEVVNERVGIRDFLTTVIFENSSVVQVEAPSAGRRWPGLIGDTDTTFDPGDEIAGNTEVAMTWNVTEAERAAMLEAIPSEFVAEQSSYLPGRPSFAKSAPDRLRHIRDLARRIDRAARPSDPKSHAPSDPVRLQQARKDLERVLNYERIEALKSWWIQGVAEAPKKR
ncbi:MAG: patatin-like phospholipase family protein [Isosphaeraceae bacterium]|nr:patatin-like phospholipase family protein [Isosphaeraceae bacterium]